MPWPSQPEQASRRVLMRRSARSSRCMRGRSANAGCARRRRSSSDGDDAAYDGMPIKEVARMTLSVDEPDPTTRSIAELGDPAWSAWMHDELLHGRVDVPELGGARSYASRLFDYGATGRDQLAWVVDRSARIPASRSATITTFEPLLDTTYIPCVSMLDFWAPARRARARRLRPQPRLRQEGLRQPRRAGPAAGAGRGRARLPVGRADVYVKSAHVYEPEWELMATARRGERRQTPARRQAEA